MSRKGVQCIVMQTIGRNVFGTILSFFIQVEERNLSVELAAWSVVSSET